MSNRVILFQPHFARLVESGRKYTTIRGSRKFPVEEGDTLSLREWTGLPYRSKQRILRTEVCTKVETFSLWRNHEANARVMCKLDGHEVFTSEGNGIARIDGFADYLSLCMWFAEVHKFPFQGHRIHWRVTP